MDNVCLHMDIMRRSVNLLVSRFELHMEYMCAHRHLQEVCVPHTRRFVYLLLL